MTTSRLSYASSPESDLELSPGPSASLSLGNLPQLVKSSSDPSIATNQDNLDRDREDMVEGMPPPYTVITTLHSRIFTFLPYHPALYSHVIYILLKYNIYYLWPYNHSQTNGCWANIPIWLMVEIWINKNVLNCFYG
jgi:hypothetical protein